MLRYFKIYGMSRVWTLASIIECHFNFHLNYLNDIGSFKFYVWIIYCLFRMIVNFLFLVFKIYMVKWSWSRFFKFIFKLISTKTQNKENIIHILKLRHHHQWSSITTLTIIMTTLWPLPTTTDHYSDRLRPQPWLDHYSNWYFDHL